MYDGLGSNIFTPYCAMWAVGASRETDSLQNRKSRLTLVAQVVF